MKIIDDLWVKHSNGKFGFSVKKKIFVEQCGGTPGEYNYDAWYKFAHTVGWRKFRSYSSRVWMYLREIDSDNMLQLGTLPAEVWWRGDWGLDHGLEVHSDLINLFSRLDDNT